MADDIKSIVAEALKGISPPASVKEGNPGMLEVIPSWKLLGLQVGDAVKGMAVAGLGDVAVSLLVKYALALLPQSLRPVGGVQTGSAISKGLAALLLQSGLSKKFLGANAANLGSLLLTMDAVNDLFQVRTTVKNMVGKLVGGFVPGSGLVWGGNSPATPIPTAVAQAGQVAESVYARLGG